MSKVPMTVRGHELLQEELKELKRVDRPSVIKAIAEARAHGDLKENAEYHAAKEQQGFIEGRIKEIEGKLSHLQVIDVTAIDAKGKVVFGSTVEIARRGLRTRRRSTGSSVKTRPDIKNGLISYTSPIARALIGKSEGDVVEFQAPGGEKSSRSSRFDTLSEASGAACRISVSFRVCPVQQRHVADSLNQLSRRRRSQSVRDDRIPCVRSADADTDLDQFVVVKRGLEFCQNSFGQAGVADHDQRLQCVAEAAQVFLLCFSECHGRGV